MKDEMADRMIGQIEKVVPDFRDLIMDKVVLTQQYFEKTFGVTAGDFAQGYCIPVRCSAIVRSPATPITTRHCATSSWLAVLATRARE